MALSDPSVHSGETPRAIMAPSTFHSPALKRGQRMDHRILLQAIHKPHPQASLASIRRPFLVKRTLGRHPYTNIFDEIAEDRPVAKRALRGFVWISDPVKTCAWQRRRASRIVVFRPKKKLNARRGAAMLNSLLKRALGLERTVVEGVRIEGDSIRLC